MAWGLARPRGRVCHRRADPPGVLTRTAYPGSLLTYIWKLAFLCDTCDTDSGH